MLKMTISKAFLVLYDGYIPLESVIASFWKYHTYFQAIKGLLNAAKVKATAKTNLNSVSLIDSNHPCCLWCSQFRTYPRNTMILSCHELNFVPLYRHIFTQCSVSIFSVIERNKDHENAISSSSMRHLFSLVSARFVCDTPAFLAITLLKHVFQKIGYFKHHSGFQVSYGLHESCVKKNEHGRHSHRTSDNNIHLLAFNFFSLLVRSLFIFFIYLTVRLASVRVSFRQDEWIIIILFFNFFSFSRFPYHLHLKRC